MLLLELLASHISILSHSLISRFFIIVLNGFLRGQIPRPLHFPLVILIKILMNELLVALPDTVARRVIHLVDLRVVLDNAVLVHGVLLGKLVVTSSSA